MLDYNIFYFLNILISGIILMQSIIIFANGSKYLKSKLHSFFWFIVFLFILLWNLETASFIKFDFSLSQYIIYFIPAFAALLIFNFNKEKFNLLTLIIFIVPAVAIIFNRLIPLFTLFYDLIIWMSLLFISFFLFVFKANKINNKKNIFIFLWTVFTSFSFLIYVVINILLSLINRRPMLIVSILPTLILISSIVVFFFFYKNNLIYNEENLIKTSKLFKHTVKEKIAASLIHEIKNPIAAIQSLNQLLQKKIDTIDKESAHKYLNIISDDLIRIKELADSYLSAYRIDNEHADNKMDIFLILKSINDLLKFDLRKKEINLVLDKSLINRKIKFSNYKFKQIFLNLIYNSIEANAKNIKIEGIDTSKNFEIIITDDGEGVKFNDIKNIFAPFFSTKSDGTGIGLSICKSIMNNDGGEIKLVSSNKEKTVFKLIFKK